MLGALNCVKSKLLLETLIQSSTLGSSAFHYSFMAVSVLSFEGENNSLIICLMQSFQLHFIILIDCNWKWQNSCHLFDQWFTEEYWIELQDGHQKKYTRVIICSIKSCVPVDFLPRTLNQRANTWLQYLRLIFASQGHQDNIFCLMPLG